MDLITDHETKDIAKLNILPPLMNSEHSVLSFTFKDSDMTYDKNKPRPCALRANISANQECAARTDKSIDTSPSVQMVQMVQMVVDGIEEAFA
ncbi:unnamed protein product [Schistosoma mattheei]|uniref:Uncharacterized protein n=1 Tax=Schistosoma mattheei TaxID=31246 RepID=A0A183Q721_9TREM|nr:unnamed protein product [Schistosoma mattheei]